MEIKIEFVNFDRTPALETFVLTHLKALKRRLQTDKPGRAKIKVKLKLDAKAPLGQLKDSHATLEARIPGIPKNFVSTKKNENLRVAVKDATEALNKMVRRETEKRERSRRTLGKSMRQVRRGRAI